VHTKQDLNTSVPGKKDNISTNSSLGNGSIFLPVPSGPAPHTSSIKKKIVFVEGKYFTTCATKGKEDGPK